MSLSGLYMPRDSIIHRLDARVKLSWFVLAFAASVVSQWDGSVSVFVYLSLIVGLALAKISVKRAVLTIVYSIIFFLVTTLVWASMYQDVGVYITTLPLINLRLTDVGLLVGTGKFFLIVNPITAFLLVMTTTKMYDLHYLITKAGLSYKAGFMFALALGLLPYTFAEIKNIVDVQKARGLEIDSRNPVKKLVYVVPIFVPLVIRMMSYVWDLSIVLSVRGFGAYPKRSYYFTPSWGRRDTVALALLVATYLLIIILKLAGFSTYYFLRGV